jgi:hypothetical protein
METGVDWSKEEKESDKKKLTRMSETSFMPGLLTMKWLSNHQF